MNHHPSDSTATRFERDFEIDILDMLAELLLRWKTLLVFVFLGALVFGAYAGFFKSDDGFVTEADVLHARSELSEERAAEVDALFAERLDLDEKLSVSRARYTSFSVESLTPSQIVQLRAKYYLFTELADAESFFSDLALTEDDYEAMRDISPDTFAGAEIADRVTVTVSSDGPERFDTPGSNDGGIRSSLISVSLYSNSEEQCRALLAILDSALQREADILRKLDPTLDLLFVDSVINHNTNDYVSGLQAAYSQEVSDYLRSLDQINLELTELSAGEQAYYHLKHQLRYQGHKPPQAPSWRRGALLGGLGGFTAAILIILCPYLCDGRVKTTVEAEEYLAHPPLNQVFIPGRKNLFSRPAAVLRGVDHVDPEEKAQMISKDLALLADKNRWESIWFFADETDSHAFAYAERIREKLSAEKQNVSVLVGDPLDSPDSLEALSRADCALAFVELAGTKRTVLQQWQSLSSRHGLASAGFIAVRLFWK